jgi:3-methyladenine DNA glycosylase AlkD
MDKDEVLTWLERRGTQSTLQGMARYGIRAKHAFGVPMAALLGLAKSLSPDHTLAGALWETGCYEARLLAALVDDPKRVTRRQMDAWAKSFENWGDCDTVCFKLFDQTPFAWEKSRQWGASRHEFVKRGAFALMASLALHDKSASDRQFLALLPLIDKGARDDRNFVKKGVSWALRAIGRRNQALYAASLALAQRLAQSEDAAPRWVGRDALRELASPKVRAKRARRGGRVPAAAR